MQHDPFIRRCLALAAAGRGHVGNGALVGALLVQGEHELAAASYQTYGGQHAERSLLASWRTPIDPDAVLYVNLEPCVEFPGKKTPPCLDILRQRDVRKVAVGMLDPDPRVAGRGIAALREAGIEVTVPILRTECEWFNRGYVTTRTKGRPWLTLKQARMHDGAIANADGTPRQITSLAQDEVSHRYLRATHDAILVGAQTIVADNPSLTVRHAEVAVQPWRMVIDPHLRTSPNARVYTDQYANRTIVVTTHQHAMSADAQVLAARGVRVWPMAYDGQVFDWTALWERCISPADDWHGITSVLVEAGSRTWQAFAAAGMCDQQVILSGAAYMPSFFLMS